MAKFEVAIYNAEVRKCVQFGDRHRQLNDDWADIHYIEISARDEPAARALIEGKYPADLGYIVDAISPILED